MRRPAHSTGFRASSQENFYLINIHRSVYVCKVTTLESVLILYFFTLYDIMIFPGEPTTPHESRLVGGRDSQPAQNMGGLRTPNTLRIDAFAVIDCK